MEQLRKIPTNFLDHQIAYHSVLPFSYNNRKLIRSYHGNNPLLMQWLVSPCFQNKKLCYNNKSDPIAQSIVDRTQICVNLDQPMSRLSNKYQMCIRDCDRSGLIGIPTLSQLTALRKLRHLFRV